MFDQEAGPLALLEESSLRRLTAPRGFVAIVADALHDVAGIVASIDSSALALTDNAGDDIDGTYAATVGMTVDVLANQIIPAPDSPAPELVVAGDQGDALRVSVLAYLPPSDTPISASFEEPPAPPVAHATKPDTDYVPVLDQ